MPVTQVSLCNFAAGFQRSTCHSWRAPKRGIKALQQQELGRAKRGDRRASACLAEELLASRDQQLGGIRTDQDCGRMWPLSGMRRL